MTRYSASAGTIISAGRNGFSGTTIEPSKTPMPPGTWLMTPILCDVRNAVKNVSGGTLPAGITKYSTAPGSIQSSDDTAICARAIHQVGNCTDIARNDNERGPSAGTMT